MSLLFIYDMSIYVNENKYYNYMFNENVVNRYKAIDDDLWVCSEFIETDDEKYLNMSSCSNQLYKAINVTKINTIDKLLTKTISNKKIIENAVSDADYIIIRTPSSVADVTVKICKRLHKPYLIEMVGCPWDGFWNHSLKGKMIAPFMYLITKNIVKNAPYVVYVTNEFLQRRYPAKGKSIACSNVKLNEISVDALDKRLEKVKSTSTKFIIGTVAALNVRYKGQQYVIEAISRLNKEGYKFEYHLVGGGDTDYLQSIAKKYNVSDKVKFIGALSHDKVFEYLDSIDIYIQPSLQEGLPRAVIEAMSRACPVVGSVCGGTPELVNKKYVFYPKKISQICDILKRFSTEVMLEESKRSFELAKEYESNLLEKRRKDFFTMFIDENRR